MSAWLTRRSVAGGTLGDGYQQPGAFQNQQVGWQLPPPGYRCVTRITDERNRSALRCERNAKYPHDQAQGYFSTLGACGGGSGRIPDVSAGSLSRDGLIETASSRGRWPLSGFLADTTQSPRRPKSADWISILRLRISSGQARSRSRLPQCQPRPSRPPAPAPVSLA